MHEQRERIVSAAERLIDERSVECISVGDVCAAARVSRGAFYAVFDDREQCLLAILDEVSARAGAAMASAYRNEPSWEDSVRAALYVLLCFFDDRPGLARFLIVSSLGGQAGLRERRAELLAVLARALEAEAPPMAVESLPRICGGDAIVGTIASLLHGRLREEPVPRLADLCGSLMGVVVLPYLDVAGVQRELSRPALTDAESSSCRPGI